MACAGSRNSVGRAARCSPTGDQKALRSPTDRSTSRTTAKANATLTVAAAAAAISDSADGMFSPAGMGIGQRLYRSAIDAALMVPGVVAVRNLTVTQPDGTVLGEFSDPGEGSFFDLPPGNVSIVGVNTGG